MKREFAGLDAPLFMALVAAVFAAVMAGLGARAVQRLADAHRQDVENYAIVRVIAPDGVDALSEATEALRNSTLVRAAAPISRERVIELLQALGGADVPPDTLPQLRLIEVDLAPAPPDTDVDSELIAAMAGAGVTADIMRDQSAPSEGDWTARAKDLAPWAALFFALLMALVVSFASRGFAAKRRSQITVMSDSGVPRARAGGLVATSAATTGFWAGLTGALAAAALALALLLLTTQNEGPASAFALLVPFDVWPIAVAPLAAAAFAAIGARRAAESYYDQASRLG